MKNLKLVLLFVILCHVACDKDDDPKMTNQIDKTIINSEQYLNAPKDELKIEDINLNGDSLKIKFSASGCSGDSWEVKLIASEDILESEPPQRNLRLSLKNKELCEAFISKTYAFEVSNLKGDGNKVVLNITNSKDKITYEYE